MKKNIGMLIIGLVIGMLLMGIIVWNVMPGKMLNVSKSKYDLEETVTAITEAAESRGWQVPKIYNLQKSLQNAGHEDMTQLKILSICQPHHAYNILKDDENKKVTAMMPCRIGVFKTKDGQVYISEMNIGLMSKMFGGTIEKVMGDVAGEEHEMLEGIIQK